jgi:predicted AAA+ superfamily ATPase
MKYMPRHIDALVSKQLGAMGALLIRGPKGCGKTETARHFAKSEIVMDDSAAVRNAMSSEPGVLLLGATPRLIDEWQNHKEIWNTVRHEVDKRRTKGQFVLTGSANPPDDVNLHSGQGRFGIMNMRTMTWAEMGYSTGEVRFADIFNAEGLSSSLVAPDLRTLCERLVIGGWPGNVSLEEDSAIIANDNMLELLCEADVSRVDGKRRDPLKVRQLLRSLARNVSTEASYETIRRDVWGEQPSLSNDTVIDYLRTLERLMMVENLSAWSTHIRSKARLRSSPKRHLADTGLACSALGLSSSKLLSDLEYLGLLFESLVLHDLRIYAEAAGAKLYHYRDSNGIEADAIIEFRSGDWGAFEIKLGVGAVDEAAKSLIALADNIDYEKVPRALALTVITGDGFAHRRDDGVTVVPFPVLGSAQ